MSKRIALLVIAALAALCISACASAPASGGYNIENGFVQFEGKQLTVKLDSNPTTGYEWTSAIEGAAVAEKSNEYVAEKTDKPVSGSGGVHTFVYEGSGSGEATITLTYARSWEQTDDDTKVEIAVTTKDGNITDTVTTVNGEVSGESHP